MNEYALKTALAKRGEQQNNAASGAQSVNGIPNSVLTDVFAGKRRATNEMMGHREELAPSIAAKMSQSFGMDFSNLKVYRSDAMAGTEMHGMAQGDKVVLSSDVDLNTQAGQATLGHELSHIRAQSMGMGNGRGLLNDAALEHQADSEGILAARGMNVSGESMGMRMGLGMQGVENLSPIGAGLGASAGAPMQAEKKKDPIPAKRKYGSTIVVEGAENIARFHAMNSSKTRARFADKRKFLKPEESRELQFLQMNPQTKNPWRDPDAVRKNLELYLKDNASKEMAWANLDQTLTPEQRANRINAFKENVYLGDEPEKENMFQILLHREEKINDKNKEFEKEESQGNLGKIYYSYTKLVHKQHQVLKDANKKQAKFLKEILLSPGSEEDESVPETKETASVPETEASEFELWPKKFDGTIGPRSPSESILKKSKLDKVFQICPGIKPSVHLDPHQGKYLTMDHYKGLYGNKRDGEFSHKSDLSAQYNKMKKKDRLSNRREKWLTEKATIQDIIAPLQEKEKRTEKEQLDLEAYLGRLAYMKALEEEIIPERRKRKEFFRQQGLMIKGIHDADKNIENLNTIFEWEDEEGS